MIAPLGGTKGAVWVRSVPYRVKKTQTPVATGSAVTSQKMLYQHNYVFRGSTIMFTAFFKLAWMCDFILRGHRIFSQKKKQPCIRKGQQTMTDVD